MSRVKDVGQTSYIARFTLMANYGTRDGLSFARTVAGLYRRNRRRDDGCHQINVQNAALRCGKNQRMTIMSKWKYIRSASADTSGAYGGLKDDTPTDT